MKKMSNLIKNKSGMTLLEIIISLAIFAIINVGFYGMFSTVFINMYKTSKITESAFLSQQVIESHIAEVKQKLKNGLVDQVTDDKLSITLFSGSNERTVSAFHLTENMINGKLVETLVAENRPPQLRVPVITSDVIIKAKNGSTTINYPNIALRDTYDIVLEGGTPTVDNEGLLIQHLYYWYISKPGFYTLSQPPLFPDDYEILAGYTAKDIVTIPESFGGKFLVLMVTPVGEKGAMGDSVISNEVFISPLPVTSNLLLHFDASWINDNEGSIEYSSDRVQKWYNISSNIPTAPNPTGSLPTIVVSQTSNRTFGVTRSSSTGTQQLSNTNAFTGTSGKQNLTVYFIANFSTSNGTAQNITLLNSSSTSTKNSFVLKTSNVAGFEGQLELIRNFDTGSSNVISGSDYRTNQWEVIKLELYTNRLAIRNQLTINNSVYSFLGNQQVTINNTSRMSLSPFSMNFDTGYTMGEIMVFDGVVTNEDEQKILKYLSDKYQ